MDKSIKFFVILLVLLFALSLSNILLNTNPLSKFSKRIGLLNSKPITFYIADSEKLHRAGLMNVDKFGPNEVMLFLFKEEKIQQFWMKNVRFDIDIVFINNEMIVDSVHHAKADNDLDVEKIRYSSVGNVSKVLELPKGDAMMYGISKGSKIDLILE